VEEIIKKILSKSKNDTEVLISDSNSTKSYLSKNYIRNTSSSNEKTILIRVTLPDGRTGCYNCEPLFWETALKKAESIAKLSEKDKDFRGIPEKQKYSRLKPSNFKISSEEFIQKSFSVLDTASQTKARVIESDCELINTTEYFGNSNGIYIKEQKTNTSFSIWTSYKKNTIISGFASSSLVDFAGKTKEICDLCIRGDGAKKLKTTKKMQIIFDQNTMAYVFSSMLTPSFDAFSKIKGINFFCNKENQKIASPNFSVFDNGLLEDGLFSSISDAEGIPRKKTPLITEGILNGFLYDYYTAGMENKESTGNSSSIISRPSISPSNIVIKKGDFSEDEIISDTKEGIIIHSLIGMGGANPVSGDFSPAVANGFYIKNGKILYPVKELMISANIFDMIKKISAIGSKAEQNSEIVSPMIRFDDVLVIG